ncbi:X-domain of DnaJ-containing-domain-containing protein [Pelagophyceae sp. CCMP2097]|nr:X-domain of DnaJ-containing-domain-containing protein [Pelagophyceae sp. CCMP2097]
MAGSMGGDVAESKDAVSDEPAKKPTDAIVEAVMANLLFSTRRPRDICAGVSSAIKSVFKGVLFGFAALIAAPVVASVDKGSVGESDEDASRRRVARVVRVAAGLGAGVVGAIALPVAGAIVGVIQIIRGVWATPAALYHWLIGDVSWDEAKREWRVRVAYSLPDDAAAALDGGAAKKRAKKKVASLEYYDLLDVESDASELQIKKGYYRVARECHPDKCGADPEASAKFQALSHAYQVLSDPQLRAAYDRDGAEATKDTGFEYDAAVFFGALFGSERFDDYVGDLALAQIGSLLTRRGGSLEAISRALTAKDGAAAQEGDAVSEALATGLVESREQYARTQRGREVKLALRLRDALEAYAAAAADADANKDATGSAAAAASFSAWAKGEATALATSDCAAGSLTDGALCHALACAYTSAADEWLGIHDSVLGLGAHLPHARARAHAVSVYAAAAGASVRGLLAAKRLTEDMQREDSDDDGEAKVSTQKPFTKDELRAMKTGDLKKLAQQNNVSLAGCVEKSNIADALFAADVSAPPNEEEPPPSKEGRKAERTNEAIKAQMPVFLDALLQVSLYDVQCTLASVCDKVLDDESVDLPQRKLRAKGLQLFGRELHAALKAARSAASTDLVKTPGKKAKDKAAAQQRFEHAMNVTMAKAMGQEMSEPDAPASA